MSDQNDHNTDNSNDTESQAFRTFKIGSQLIHEDETTREMDNEAVRDFLKGSYPEVAHATIREQTLDDGTILISYLPKIGRKG
ncbi:MAG: hypothetical protein WBC91_19785 [Phototrophicaceae bacterium]